jgi:hypothetical protein
MAKWGSEELGSEIRGQKLVGSKTWGSHQGVGKLGSEKCGWKGGVGKKVGRRSGGVQIWGEQKLGSEEWWERSLRGGRARVDELGRESQVIKRKWVWDRRFRGS